MHSRTVSLIATLLLALAPAAAEASRKLKISSLEAPSTAKASETIEVSGAAGNAGTRRARGTVRVRFDAVGTEQLLGADPVRVRTDRVTPFSVVAQLPSTVPAGQHRIRACIRRHGHRGRERCRGAPLTIEGSGPPPPPPPPPEFTPGATTAGDPILPQLGNGGYDARHYSLVLDYDPAANVFETATMTMTARATQNLSELSLDFQDLPVDGVTVDGVPAGFAQVDAVPPLSGGGTQPMKLVVTPVAGIPDGAEFELRVAYHGQPQVITDPDGSIEGWIPSPVCAPPASCNSHFVVGEPMGSQAWFPSNDHPSDKATYETQITVPAGEVAVAVGELESQTTSGGSATWTWREDDPTASYLVTASNGNFDFVPGSVTEALTSRSIPIYDSITNLALPNQRTAIDALTARNKEMIDALGAHYGPYPLDSYGSVWDNLPNVGYALEVQTKSHFSFLPVSADSQESTYLHELAHQWWGNAVTLEHWNDIWFNEGFARLSEWIFGFESGADPDSPEQHFDDEYDGASADDWSVAPAVLDNDPALLFETFPTYTRGAMTLEGYREIIGAGPFDDFCRVLQSELAFDNISTVDFIARAKAVSGFTGAKLQLLDDYFQQWLYGTTKPTLTPEDFQEAP